MVGLAVTKMVKILDNREKVKSTLRFEHILVETVFFFFNVLTLIQINAIYNIIGIFIQCC